MPLRSATLLLYFFTPFNPVSERRTPQDQALDATSLASYSTPSLGLSFLRQQAVMQGWSLLDSALCLPWRFLFRCFWCGLMGGVSGAMLIVGGGTASSAQQPDPTRLTQLSSANLSPTQQSVYLTGQPSVLLLAQQPSQVPSSQPQSASAPADLVEVLAQIDTAASSQDLPQVMQFFAEGFTNSDGLTREGLADFLSRFWQDYTQVSYRTEIVSWRQEGSVLIAETITRISGTRQAEGRTFRLQASLTARQRFDNRRIVEQEILAEQSQLLSGSNPPTVRVMLPSTVAPGQDYTFDAIVQEPLGGDFLLGAVSEQPVKSDRYMSPAPSTLQALAAGGIFKIGRAPQQPSDRWISAILIRQGGITVVTQRLRVIN